MQIKVVAYGIAKEILQSHEMNLEIGDTQTLQEVRSLLATQYPELNRLASLRFAVNESYQDDEFQLSANDEVVIIPPVSGG